MASISTAISLDRVSAAVGYEVKQSNKGAAAGFLPQRLEIWTEIATDKTSAPDEVDATTAFEVGEAYGYNSPAYAIARIIRPLFGNPFGSIPTVFKKLPIAGTPTIKTVTPAVSTVTTKTVTHALRINGKTSIDGNSYKYVVPVGSTQAEVAQIIVDTVNNVLACPLDGALSTDTAVLTSGWTGVTSAGITIEIEVGNETGGITYAIDDTQDGTGVATLTGPAQALDEKWTTFIINGAGYDADNIAYIESVCGNVAGKTGRYDPEVWMPFKALTGTKISTLTEAEGLTAASINEQATVFCPAPLSEAMDYEIAAAYARAYIPMAQDMPHKDVMGTKLADIHVPSSIGDFGDSAKRDQMVKAGMSTVKLNAGQYEILDFVTTYHPASESQTQMSYRFVNDETKRWNVKFSDKYLAEIYVKGKTLVKNGSSIGATETISPDEWEAILETIHFPFLVDNAIITGFNDLESQIGETNNNRLETFYGVTLTGTGRVLSTTIETSY